MTLKQTSKKRKEIKLMRLLNEKFQHRRHNKPRKRKNHENSIEKKQKLEQIIYNEHNQLINKLKKSI